MSAGSGRTFLRDETHFTGGYSRGVFRAVGMAYRPWLWRVVALLGLGLIARFLLLANTNVMGYWVDTLCEHNCRPLPVWLQAIPSERFPLILAGLTLVGFVVNTLFRIAISRIGTHAVSLFYDEVVLRTSRFPMSFFDSTPVGRMLTRFGSDYAAIFRMAGGPMGEFLCLVFDLLLIIVLTGIASPWFLPLVVTATVLTGLLYKRNQMGIRTARRAVSRARSPAIAHFSETVQGASIIRVFGRDSTFVARFLRLVDDFAATRIRSALVLSGFSLQMTGAVALLVLSTGAVGLLFVQRGLVSVGDVGVAFTFVMMSSNTVASFFDWLSNLEEALTGFERLDEYLRHELEPGARLPAEAQFRTGQPQERALQEEDFARHPLQKSESADLSVTGLSMRYRADLPLVLNDITFRVNPGEHVGIIGRTGSGKSSLIQAIFHLYPFEKGEVAIAGHSPFSREHPVPIDLFRSIISLIPQDPLLFQGTLRDNLCRGQQASDDQLMNLLKLVGLEDLVRTQPEGLNLGIHEKGANLSQGQRQLLALARALGRPTPILILDEATSAIDPASEARLVEALRDRLAGRTRIVVAHRLSTLRDADRILWMHEGRIHRHGPPSEVLPEFERSVR